jgi:Flp pilus assembly protein TadG
MMQMSQVGRWFSTCESSEGAVLGINHRKSERRTSRRGSASERGSTLVLTAIGIVAIVGFAGLAVDVGSLRATKRHLQAAVDAAALAAALAVPNCGAGVTGCAGVSAAATSALSENGYAGAIVQNSCSASSGTSLTLTVNNPPCLLAGNDPNNGSAKFVEVSASMSQSTNFASVLGYSNVMISARAEAKVTPNPNCIYALDTSGANAISVDALSVVNSSCGIVDESTATSALSCSLIASVQAPSIEVVGGSSSFLCLLPGTVPKTNAPLPPQADPLSAVPKPTVPACGPIPILFQTTFHGSATPLSLALGTFTLYPDAAYCGGITILPTANVTFMPGVYSIKSIGIVGGMSIAILATVQGTGVTFYNYGPKGGITMVAPGGLGTPLASINLTAPTNGTYACMLFMQDPQNTDTATILGQSSWNTTMVGAYYFPNARVLYAASLSSAYNIVVAKDVEFLAASAGSSVFNQDYSTIPSGCPMAGGGSVLVQ